MRAMRSVIENINCSVLQSPVEEFFFLAQFLVKREPAVLQPSLQTEGVIFCLFSHNAMGCHWSLQGHVTQSDALRAAVPKKTTHVQKLVELYAIGNYLVTM